MTNRTTDLVPVYNFWNEEFMGYYTQEEATAYWKSCEEAERESYERETTCTEWNMPDTVICINDLPF